MEYKRVTERTGIYNTPCFIGDFNNEIDASIFAIEALAKLEDMIENGTLIERYYIQEDEMPNGKVWYNVCELNENYGSIKKQCATRREAEALLAELRGNA